MGRGEIVQRSIDHRCEIVAKPARVIDDARLLGLVEIKQDAQVGPDHGPGMRVRRVEQDL